jgi:sulfate adenylyltransferase subunit 2
LTEIIFYICVFSQQQREKFSSLYGFAAEFLSLQDRGSEMHLLDNDQAGDGLAFTGLKKASSVPQISAEGRASAPSMDHLDALEAQSIYILREAFARLKKLALLWSLGKDSNVMIWLARKAFFGRVPFPALHVDTGKKFPEMYAFRDRYGKEWDLDLRIEPCPPIDAVDPTLPPAARSAARKTEGLKLALSKYGFDGLIAGIRRDEEATRAKERVFSPRGIEGGWDVRDQPPEFWDQFNASPPPGAHLRVHPILHWTEADIWAYTKRENIPIIRLYLAQNGRRYRSLGDADITFPIASSASDIDEILAELELTKVPERAGRALDHETEDAFERLRATGYL